MKVFDEDEAQQFPPSRSWDHAIELKANTLESLNCKVYPLNQTKQNTLREFLNEQLVKEYIWPSKSQYASPFFFIKKKDRELCPVQDYCNLNKYTIPNHAPLPLIVDKWPEHT